MKTLSSILIFLFFFASCLESENENSEKEKTIEEKEYRIAYNIHSPDTTVDDWDMK